MNRSGSMTKLVAGLAVALVALVSSAQSARADVIESFDGPVTIGPTQAAGTWYTDRYAPAGFSSPTNAPDGRPGTLQHSISASDSSANRPGAFSSAFYNTQGRKYDLPGGMISAQIQMYVPASWNSLNQSESPGRLASFWATTNVPAPNDTYPIIEYNNDRDGSGTNGFRVWDDDVGGWVNVGGYGGDDQWYDLAFDINGSTFRYFVNGSLVYTDTTTNGSTSLANVILQGYNSGNPYDIHWDNFSASANAIPEPTTLALFGLGSLVLVAVRFRRRGATV